MFARMKITLLNLYRMPSRPTNKSQNKIQSDRKKKTSLKRKFTRLCFTKLEALIQVFVEVAANEISNKVDPRAQWVSKKLCSGLLFYWWYAKWLYRLSRAFLKLRFMHPYHMSRQRIQLKILKTIYLLQKYQLMLLSFWYLVWLYICLWSCRDLQQIW